MSKIASFWAARGTRPGVAAAILVTWLLGVVPAAGNSSECSLGEVQTACPASPVGPDGLAVSDHFFFVHQELTGDGTITVRLTSMTGRVKQPPPPGTQGPGPAPVPGMVPWAKAGVMVKDGIRQGSPYAAVLATAEHGVRMQHNFLHDTAGQPGGVSAEHPRWLRLTRARNTVTGEESLDGKVWTTVGTVRTELPQTVRIGMFAASPGAVTGGESRFSEVTAEFDQVSLAGPWQSDDIGVTMEPDGKTPHHPGGVRETPGGFAVTGVGDVGPATGDAGLTTQSLLAGVPIGMFVLIIVAARFAARSRRPAATETAAPLRAAPLRAAAIGVAAIAFAAGLLASAGALLGAKLVLDAKGVPVYTVTLLTEARVVVGLAVLTALASVLALALGALLRRAFLAITVTVLTLFVPYYLAISDIAGAEVSRWLLRLTPAAGFAAQQSVPDYGHVVTSGMPAQGHYPLAGWAGLAVTGASAAVALGLAIARSRRASV